MVYTYDCQGWQFILNGLFWTELDKNKTDLEPMGAVTGGFKGLVYIWGICEKSIHAFQYLKLICMLLLYRTLAIKKSFFDFQNIPSHHSKLIYRPLKVYYTAQLIRIFTVCIHKKNRLEP